VSRNGTLLPIPLDPVIGELRSDWSAFEREGSWPRSRWLRLMEDILSVYYPAASSADLKLTARSLAPFPLALGPNVP